MKVLVNALSVTNQSGRHVLMGHLNQLRDWTEGEHEYVILHHETNRDLVVDKQGFRWVECPAKTATWTGRALWEYRNLNRIAGECNCDFVFSPAGVSVPGINIPQVVFCQNPWCLVSELHQHPRDRVKAWIQRNAYRRTMSDATLMIYNSNYMRDAYRINAGREARDSLIVYQAISESTWNAAETLGKSLREPNHIVSVSAMAPHKGADRLVRALRLVRQRGIDAKLTFAGGWPDNQYRAKVQGLVSQLDLSEAVTFSGWISEEELHRLYSRAHVFCLLSRCESFGIPAVEAQSFGTPAIGTDTCAIPEIGGDGGLYSPVDDVESAADNLTRALSDESEWNELSRNAVKNAQKYRWNVCSRELLKMFTCVSNSK